MPHRSELDVVCLIQIEGIDMGDEIQTHTLLSQRLVQATDKSNNSGKQTYSCDGMSGNICHIKPVTTSEAPPS